MQVATLELDGLRLITPRVYRDSRGFFLESFSATRYGEIGIDCPFVQDNHSLSQKGTLRGLHYQQAPGQAKLVRVVRGQIFDVAVDIRPQSPTFGRWAAAHLDSDTHQQLFIPAGFAHGFYVMSDVAEVLYKCSTPYDPSTEKGFAFGDVDLGILWPDGERLLSDRDQKAPSFDALCQKLGRENPRFGRVTRQ